MHPEYGSPQAVIETGRAYGVDVFSPLFPSISNHPVYFGANTKTPISVRDALMSFDSDMRDAVNNNRSINLSAWVGIAATRGNQDPKGMPYKYPLGTAQLLLAVLEAAGLNPRLFDRQFLPWLIANCDGGVDSIRTYAWNVETWWSALAAAVGPQATVRRSSRW